ncbi:MAG: restriction endonuclease subunit S [Chloroflexota bacterium]
MLEILSAYDDLIDNNNRRIALLEEAIHRLYREWFVHLRFPGHEHTPVVAGVPEGWEKRPLAEIAHINAESIRKNNAPENIEYIDISSVGTGIINEIKAIDFADAPSRARRIVKHGDIIWSTVRPGNRAYSLILNPNPNTIASTGFAVLTAQIVPFTFLYQAVITDEFVEHMAKVAKGAAYPAVSTSDFEKVKILVPSQSLLNEFEQMAKPIARQTQTLRLQNEKLREARDALLPRLMNGSLPV